VLVLFSILVLFSMLELPHPLLSGWCGGGFSSVEVFGGFGKLLHSWWFTDSEGGGSVFGDGFVTGFCLLHGVARWSSCGGGVALHLGGGSASLVVLFACGGRLYMTVGSCGYEMLLLGLLWLCVGLGFCYGLGFGFLFFMFMF
jgi:hypothetical protein